MTENTYLVTGTFQFEITAKPAALPIATPNPKVRRPRQSRTTILGDVEVTEREANLYELIKDGYVGRRDCAKAIWGRENETGYTSSLVTSLANKIAVKGLMIDRDRTNGEVHYHVVRAPTS